MASAGIHLLKCEVSLTSRKRVSLHTQTYTELRDHPKYDVFYYYLSISSLSQKCNEINKIPAWFPRDPSARPFATAAPCNETGSSPQKALCPARECNRRCNEAIVRRGEHGPFPLNSKDVARVARRPSSTPSLSRRPSPTPSLSRRPSPTPSLSRQPRPCTSHACKVGILLQQGMWLRGRPLHKEVSVGRGRLGKMSPFMRQRRNGEMMMKGMKQREMRQEKRRKKKQGENREIGSGKN